MAESMISTAMTNSQQSNRDFNSQCEVLQSAFFFPPEGCQARTITAPLTLPLFHRAIFSSKKLSGQKDYEKGYQLPAASIQTESSHVQGINNEESTGESSKDQVSSFVGWTGYKKYGMHEVRGVVLSYNQDNKLCDVLYDDGKPEKVTTDSLVRYLSPCRPGPEPARGSSLRMNAQNAGSSRPAKKATKRKRAGTAAPQLRQVPCGSATAETPTADSGNERKKPYRSLRMNTGP